MGRRFQRGFFFRIARKIITKSLQIVRHACIAAMQRKIRSNCTNTKTAMADFNLFNMLRTVTQHGPIQYDVGEVLSFFSLLVQHHGDLTILGARSCFDHPPHPTRYDRYFFNITLHMLSDILSVLKRLKVAIAVFLFG